MTTEYINSLTAAQTQLLEFLLCIKASMLHGLHTGLYTGVGYPHTDMADWAESGVVCVDSYKRYSLEAEAWDAYKMAHGIRPRWMDFDSMSTAELEEFVDGCYREYHEECEREERAKREREERRMREANRRKDARRRFDKQFNSLAMALG